MRFRDSSNRFDGTNNKFLVADYQELTEFDCLLGSSAKQIAYHIEFFNYFL